MNITRALAARPSIGYPGLQQIPMTTGLDAATRNAAYKTLKGWCVRINSPDRQRGCSGC